MIAHAQNACSSSRSSRRRVPVAGSAAQTLRGSPCGRAARISVCPAAVNSWPGPAWRAAASSAWASSRRSGGAAGQDRQHREPLAGPGVHPGLAAADELASAAGPPGRMGHGATHGPHRAGSSSAHCGQVEVERPDAGQCVEVAEPLRGDRRSSRPSRWWPSWSWSAAAVSTRRRHRGAGAASRCRGGGVPGLPRKHLASWLATVPQGHVVDRGLAFLQVVHEQVPDRAAGDRVAVDEFLDGALPGAAGSRARWATPGPKTPISRSTRNVAAPESRRARTARSASRTSSTSPIVMSASVPPLAAMITAQRNSDLGPRRPG